MNKLILSALLFTSCASSPILPERNPAQYSPSELKSFWVGNSSKERKMVTSNSVHYWAWSQNESSRYLGAYLDSEGVVMGDPHVKNVFDYRVRGGKANLAIADIDDSGRGPLLFDFARYVIYIKAAVFP